MLHLPDVLNSRSPDSSLSCKFPVNEPPIRTCPGDKGKAFQMLNQDHHVSPCKTLTSKHSVISHLTTHPPIQGFFVGGWSLDLAPIIPLVCLQFHSHAFCVFISYSSTSCAKLNPPLLSLCRKPKPTRSLLGIKGGGENRDLEPKLAY